MRREERLMEGIRVKGREGESNGESNRAIRRERGDTETEIGRERERGERGGGGRENERGENTHITESAVH